MIKKIVDDNVNFERKTVGFLLVNTFINGKGMKRLR